MKKVIAIDGPSASGKGTMARRLASHFSYEYLDTGLMYRLFAYLNISYNALCEFSFNDYLAKLDSIDQHNLRTDQVSKLASFFAKDQKNRKEITRLQLELIEARNGADIGCVLDGRDIGTVVVPDAFCKFFVTASLEIRSQRRFKDLKKCDHSVTLKDVYMNLQSRDREDLNREHSPLQVTDGYFVIDTSEHSENESFEAMKRIVESCLAKAFD